MLMYTRQCYTRKLILSYLHEIFTLYTSKAYLLNLIYININLPNLVMKKIFYRYISNNAKQILK